MKIEKINDDKLIITLDINDLKSKNIDTNSFLHNSPETQDLFWDVMQEAERMYGFNIDESMLRVDAHVSNTGIYTLIVTKSPSKIDVRPSENPEQKRKTIRLKRKEISGNQKTLLYAFDKFSDLLEYAKVFEGSDNTSLYILNEKFYLLLSSPDMIISEYAVAVQNSSIMMSKIKEYGKEIYLNNAIEQLLLASS